MIPAGCCIKELDADPTENTITAIVTGLTNEEIETIAEDFQDELGMALNLKGQLALF